MPVLLPVYLVMTNVPPESWHSRIDGRRKLIGRSPLAQIRVPSKFKQVSRRHAEIWREREEVWLLDLNSSGGTRVNGVQLMAGQPQRVVLGDRIWLGGLELQLVTCVSLSADAAGGSDLHHDVLPVPDDIGLTVKRQATLNSDPRTELNPLSPAEREIVLWLCRGFTEDEEIAQALSRSAHTVRTHMARIFQKLGVHSRSELLGRVRRGELQLDLPNEEPEAPPITPRDG